MTTEERNRLAIDNLGLVHAVAAKAAELYPVDYEDAVGEGMLALLREIPRHDHNRQPLSRFLSNRLRLRLVDWMRTNPEYTRHSDRLTLLYSIDDTRDTGTVFDVPCRGPLPSEQAEASLRANRVRSAMRCLPSRWRMVVIWHYWGGLSSGQIASGMGVTGNRVCKILRDARRRMRAALEAAS